MALAVMLNISKWIYFNMRIMISIKMNKHRQLLRETDEDENPMIEIQVEEQLQKLKLQEMSKFKKRY